MLDNREQQLEAELMFLGGFCQGLLIGAIDDTVRSGGLHDLREALKRLPLYQEALKRKAEPAS